MNVRIQNRLLHRICICMCCCLVAVNSVSAQENPGKQVYAQTIHTTDGSVLRGEIIQWNAEEVTMRLTSGIEITLPLNTVGKIVSRRTSARASNKGEVKIRNRESQFNEPGLYSALSMGFSAGPKAGFGMTHAVGHRFSRLLGAGGGIGVDIFDFNADRRFVTVFAEARGFLLDRNISPYYLVRAGYGFAMKGTTFGETERNGGAMWNAEIGYRFGGWRQVNFFMGLGFRYQYASYLYEFPWSERIEDHVTFRRTEMKFGVIF